MKPRFKEHYDDTVKSAMKSEFEYGSDLEVPRLEKIVINMGVGEAVADSKKLDAAMAEMAKIAGQKPVPTKAKKSIAGFKIRDGMPIGCKVTLRKDRMYEFLDRLVTIALPRVLRRPRQLRHGPEGADRVPGNRIRPGRRDPRHGHHHLHDRQDRRRSPVAVAEIRYAVPAVTAGVENYG